MAAAALAASDDAVDLCGHSAELCGLRSFSGFLPIPDVGSLFYWYFVPSSVDKEAPLLLWLQGGPGSSSMTGALFEQGPVTLDGDGVLRRQPPGGAWSEFAPIVFVDSPVGTGWSFAQDDAGYARSQHDVAHALTAFLNAFAEAHPEAPRRLVLTGESYGGHFVPALGAHLLRHPPRHHQLEAIAVGDGFTDPATQVLTKPQVAFAFGLVDEEQFAEAQRLAQEAHDLAELGNYTEAASSRKAMEELVKKASHINPYDVRSTTPYDFEAKMQVFFDKNHTKDLLHVPREVRYGTSPRVAECLSADIMRSQKGSVDELLAAGVRVLLYQGQFDWKDGVASNEAWIRTLSWPGIPDYLKASRSIWKRAGDGQIAGYWRSWKNLEQVVVLGAGHLVPMDQPLSAADMMQRFLGLGSYRGTGAAAEAAEGRRPSTSSGVPIIILQ